MTTAIWVTFLIYVKEITFLLSGQSPPPLENDFKELKKLLDLLRKEEPGADYLANLSSVWKRIHQKSQTKQMHDFLSSIADFPEKEDYPLGYYLFKEAGKDWTPYPAIEILRMLHEEPEHKTLINWIIDLKKIAQDPTF